MSPQEKQRFSRSKSGCYNCKRLKIKCDEEIPICSHCVKTKHECIYKPVNIPTSTAITRDLSLRASIKELRITQFQYRLLKHFMETGYQVLSGGANTETMDIWTNDVPGLFSRMPAVRNSIYTISMLSLWGKYKLSDIPNLTFNDDGTETSLLVETTKSFNQLVHDMQTIQYDQNQSYGLSAMVSVIVFLKYLGYHSLNSIPMVDFINPDNPMDLMSLSQTSIPIILRLKQSYPSERYDILYGTPETLVLPEAASVSIPMIRHLREYLLDHPEVYRTTRLSSFVTILDRMNTAIYRSIQAQSLRPIHLSFPFITFGLPEQDQDLRKGHYFSMKLAFCYAAICAMFNFQVSRETSIWSQYMDTFMAKWPEHDIFDAWLYEKIVLQNFKLQPNQIHHLLFFGRNISPYSV